MQQLTNRAGKAVCNAGKTTENYSLYRVGIFKTMHDIKNVCYSGQIVLQFCAEMNCIFPYLLFAQKKKKKGCIYEKNSNSTYNVVDILMKWSYFMLEIIFLQDLNLNILEIFFFLH